MMNRDRNPEVDELHAIIDEKLTALVRELEEADWNAQDIVLMIDDILRKKWLNQVEALRRVRASVPENFLSDGNEG